MPARKPMIEGDPKPRLLQVIGSVLGAFWVSSCNRSRDFPHGKAVPFVLVGILLTLPLAGILILVVKLVVPGSPRERVRSWA